MSTLVIGIIMIVITALLVLVVLIQNPKGGGLSSSFGAASNQFMDVKKTGDFLERSTWVFFGGLLVLCLSFTAVSSQNKPKTTTNPNGSQGTEFTKKMQQKYAPAQQQGQGAPADGSQAPDTTKK